MVDENNQYQGKPIAYLDQNILDLFIDGEHKKFAENLKSKFQIVYSNETLKEIQRSGDWADKFLNILRDLGAYYLKLEINQPEFKETGKATLTNCDPFHAFREYCENTNNYDFIQSPIERLLFKFSGGLNGVGISEIHHEQKEAFSNLMNQLRTQIQEFAGENPVIECLFDEYENEMATKLEGTLDEIEILLNENISEDKNWSVIKDFRSVTKLGPKELNNIKPPHVLKKIWAKHKIQSPFNTLRNL